MFSVKGNSDGLILLLRKVKCKRSIELVGVSGGEGGELIRQFLVGT